ncbi:MAG: MBL fold metallo-hydrolase [Actinobacteria bacterium]|nr:MBL fold metallo-hydrolase [Actinomycetota bacterium]
MAVVDPGPALPDHRAALRRTLGRGTVSHVLITHRHLDHLAAATTLAPT